MSCLIKGILCYIYLDNNSGLELFDLDVYFS